MNNSLEENIRRHREFKGFSQEYMAQELGITQSSYAKIEKGNTKLTIDRLQLIAEILGVDASALLNPTKQPIFNQTNGNGSYGNGYVENLYVENKEMSEKLLEAKDQMILELKKEIEFLRSIIK